MATDIDFHGIGEDLRTLLETNLAASAKAVLHEADAIQLSPYNTPLVHIYMGSDGASQVRAGQSYYDTWTYVVEIICIDLTSWAEAAKNRTALFRLARGVVRSNPRWHGDLDASQLRGFEFERAIDSEDETWFAAVARFEVVCNAFYDRN